MFDLFKDLGMVDLEDYKYSGANITAMRLIDPERPQVRDIITEWQFQDSTGQESPLQGGEYLQVSYLHSICVNV